MAVVVGRLAVVEMDKTTDELLHKLGNHLYEKLGEAYLARQEAEAAVKRQVDGMVCFLDLHNGEFVARDGVRVVLDKSSRELIFDGSNYKKEGA